MQAQLIADIKIHQVCIYRRIYDLQSPEQQEENDGIVLILTILIPVGTDRIGIPQRGKISERGIFDLSGNTVRYRQAIGCIEVYEGYRLLALRIKTMVTKESISGYAYCRVHQRQLPVFMVVDLPKTGAKRRIQGSLSWIVLLFGKRVHLVGLFLMPLRIRSAGKRIGYIITGNRLTFYSRRDSVIFHLALAIAMQE